MKAKSKTKTRAKGKVKKVARKAPKAKKAAAPQKAAPQPGHGSIVHIDLAVPNLETDMKAYQELFGWQVFPFQPKEHYFHAQGDWGPGGCVAEGPIGKCVVYVQVNDILETCSKAEKLGGSVVLPKNAIPGGHGFCAHLKMPEGNVIGVWSRT